MLKFIEFLNEAATRQPKVTDKQELKNNQWLFNHVAGAIKSSLAARIQFAAQEDEKGFQYTRNSIYYNETRGSQWNPTGITLVTDSKRKVISLIYRKLSSRDQKLGRYLKNYYNNEFVEKQHMLIDKVDQAIDKVLKNIGKVDSKSKIDSGSQYGYTWKMESFDFDVEPQKRIRSSTTHQLEKTRKTDERQQIKIDLSKSAINRVYKELQAKINNVRSEMKSGTLFSKLENHIKQVGAKVIDVNRSKWGIAHKVFSDRDRELIIVDLRIYFDSKDDQYLGRGDKHLEQLHGKNGRYIYGFNYNFEVWYDPQQISYGQVINMTPSQLVDSKLVSAGKGFGDNAIFIVWHNSKDVASAGIYIPQAKHSLSRSKDATGRDYYFFPHDKLEKQLLDECSKTKIKDIAKIHEA